MVEIDQSKEKHPYDQVRMNIQDFSGKPDHSQLRREAYDKADFFILCYSLADQGKSFERLETWLMEMGEHRPQMKEDTKLEQEPEETKEPEV